MRTNSSSQRIGTRNWRAEEQTGDRRPVRLIVYKEKKLFMRFGGWNPTRGAAANVADHNTGCSSPFFLVQVMSPLSCAQLFKSRVKGGHRQLDKQPTPRQIASLFRSTIGAPLANMFHMFRGSLAAGATFFCPAAQPPNPKRFIDRSRRFQRNRCSCIR